MSNWTPIITQDGLKQRRSPDGIVLTLVKLTNGLWHALRDDPVKGVHTAIARTETEAWQATQREANK